MASNAPRTNWQEMLKDSSWVTIAWEWFQKLLGRSVDLVLWVTMIFSGYQLIPGAPQPALAVSTFMFVLQFIALDVGGLGLNQLAQQQGLGRWAYARVVAYILIGITLVTITYSGIHHAVATIPADWNTGIEVTLVIARAVMTVFYGQAIKSLKHDDRATRNRLAELEAEAPVLREQVSTVQQHLSSVQSQVSTLEKELDGSKQRVSTLQIELDSEKRRVAQMQKELETGHGDTASLRRELNAALVKAETLQTQLDGKKQELVGLRETLESGQEWQESRVRGVLETEQQRLSSLQQQLSGEQAAAVELRKQLNAATIEGDSLRQQLDAKRREVQEIQTAFQQRVDAKQRDVERVQQVLNGEQQTVSSFMQALEAEQSRVSTLRQKLETVQVSSGQGKVDNGHDRVDGGQGKVVRLDTSRPRKSGQGDAAENAIAEQIRALMAAEPGISGRQIAARIGCSPTTAAKWKSTLEQSPECVNE